MKKYILALAGLFAVAIVASPAMAVQSVEADANFAGTEGAHFTGDFVLTVADNTDIDDGAGNDGIAVTTATNNTGSLGFNGTSTVTGVVGSSASVGLRQITAGRNEETVLFSNNVFATTTTFSGNGTVTLADNANLTSAVTTLTNNTGSLNFLGTSLVTGQVGTSSAKVSTITGGLAGERVTFANDVFATTTKITGSGTVTFNGDVTSAVEINGNGLLQLGDGADLVGAVTTNANNTGSVLYSGTSAITSAVGSVAGNDLSAVTIEGGVVTLNSGTDYAVTTTTIRTNTVSGVSGTLKLGQNSTITGVVQVNGAGKFDASQYQGTVTGDFALTSGTTLMTTIVSTGASSSTAGHVIASTAADDAQVAAAANVDVNVTPDAYVSNGQVFMLVDGHAAGSGVVAPTTLTDNSATLSFATSAANNDLLMTATRANMSTLATNAAGASVGSTLNGFGSNATGDMATVIANLDTLSTAQAYTDAVNQLDPDMNGGANQASFNSTGGALSTVSTRLHNARAGVVNGGGQNGISSGDEFIQSALWTQGFGAYGDQDTKDGIAGYTTDTWGVAVGMDYLQSEHVRLGLSFAYAQGNVDTNGDASSTDIDTYQGTIYGSYEADSWYLDGSFSFGWHAYDGSRRIQFASIDRTAAQDYDGRQYSTKWAFGYPIALAENWQLVPVASLLYSHLRIDEFTEAGASSLNLTVAEQDYDFLQQGLGARIVTEWTDDRRQKWAPSFHAMWLYDYIGDSAQTTSTFAAGGNSFTVEGHEPEQSSMNLGAGITVYPNDSLSLSVGYDFEYRSDYTGHSGSATLRYDF